MLLLSVLLLAAGGRGTHGLFNATIRHCGTRTPPACRRRREFGASEGAGHQPHHAHVRAAAHAEDDAEPQQRPERPWHGRLRLGRFDGAAVVAVRIRHGSIFAGRRPGREGVKGAHTAGSRPADLRARNTWTEHSPPGRNRRPCHITCHRAPRPPCYPHASVKKVDHGPGQRHAVVGQRVIRHEDPMFKTGNCIHPVCGDHGFLVDLDRATSSRPVPTCADLCRPGVRDGRRAVGPAGQGSTPVLSNSDISASPLVVRRGSNSPSIAVTISPAAYVSRPIRPSRQLRPCPYELV